VGPPTNLLRFRWLDKSVVNGLLRGFLVIFERALNRFDRKDHLCPVPALSISALLPDRLLLPQGNGNRPLLLGSAAALLWDEAVSDDLLDALFLCLGVLER
jgi:hypothetical protein